MLEQPFMKELIIAIGARNDMRVWRTNTGSVRTFYEGRVGRFHAGPPSGHADIHGILRPEGWLLSIETKGAKTKKLAAQDLWGAMVAKFGGIYVRVRYDESRSMDDNVTRAVREIEAAIARRRGSAMSMNKKRDGEKDAPPSPPVCRSTRAKAGTR